MKNKKFITLKEAAEISGYSPDYIGQLIREGKIPGKRVYRNVVWVTTEDAIKDYASSSKQRDKSSRTLKERWRELKIKAESAFSPVFIMKSAFYLSLAVAVLFSLFLFFILSVSIDKQIEQNILESTTSEQSSLQIETINNGSDDTTSQQ